jgi:hypothetical protein
MVYWSMVEERTQRRPQNRAHCATEVCMQKPANWLREILEEAAEKVKGKPDWMRSPELRAELARFREPQPAPEQCPTCGAPGKES